jgi:DNA-binding response OmpR family regulator
LRGDFPRIILWDDTEVAVGFLVVEGSLSARETLCYALLSFGIKGIPAATRSAAWEILKTNKDIQGAIIDIDNQEVEGSKLIEEIRQGESTKALPVIVHTAQASKEFVMKMIEVGVAGYLLKPFHEDSSRGKLAGILDKLSEHNSQRKHIRIKPDPEELIRVHFRLSGLSALVSGKLIDISLGGIALDLYNPPDPIHLPTGQRIARIQFSLGPRELSPGGIVVAYKASVLALRFDALSPADKISLERYIFKRIS